MRTLFAASCFVLWLCMSVAAEEPLAPSKPSPEHQWLKQFAGEWSTEAESVIGPDQPAIKCNGVMKSRMLGELWIVSDLKSEIPSPAASAPGDAKTAPVTVHAVQTIGYDAEKKKYIGTWVDSMFSHLWMYEGWVDASGKKLTLEAEGPNFMSQGKRSKFRDAYEFKSPDVIELSSSMQAEDGKWVTYMTSQIRRKK